MERVYLDEDGMPLFGEEAEKAKREFHERRREVYKDLRSSRIREREKFDKLIITLITGALILSVSFVTSLVDKIKLVYLQLLFLAWLYLVISVFFILFSYLTVDLHFKKAENDFQKKGTYEENSIWAKLTDYFNRFAVV